MDMYDEKAGATVIAPASTEICEDRWYCGILLRCGIGLLGLRIERIILYS